MRKISSNKSIVQLIKFILGKFISSLGNSMYNFGISFYILSKTGSAKLFSINLAIMIIVNIITTPLSGYIADAGNKKKIIVCSQIGQSIFMFILLLTIYIKGFSIICILVTNIAITFLNALSTPSLNSTLPNIVYPNYLQKINAYYDMTNSITTLIGPIIGGVIYTLFNVKIIIVLFIISFIISGIIDMSINFSLFKKDIYNTRNLNGHIMKNFNYGLKYIKGKIVVFRLIILSMISNFFLELY
ncbi:TPA: MFS transporter [Staphylococcus aureus]